MRKSSQPSAFSEKKAVSIQLSALSQNKMGPETVY
jgi:hypothetical protein